MKTLTSYSPFLDFITSFSSSGIRNTPQSLELKLFEMLYGRPFLKNDLLLLQEMAELTKYVTSLSSFWKQLQSLENRISKPKESKRSLYNPGNLVLVKTIPGSISSLASKWEGPFSIILSSPTAVKLIVIHAWIRHTKVKPWKSPGDNRKDHPTPPEENSQENYQCLEYQYTPFRRIWKDCSRNAQISNSSNTTCSDTHYSILFFLM